MCSGLLFVLLFEDSSKGDKSRPFGERGFLKTLDICVKDVRGKAAEAERRRVGGILETFGLGLIY